MLPVVSLRSDEIAVQGKTGRPNRHRFSVQPARRHRLMSLLVCVKMENADLRRYLWHNFPLLFNPDSCQTPMQVGSPVYSPPSSASFFLPADVLFVCAFPPPDFQAISVFSSGDALPSYLRCTARFILMTRTTYFLLCLSLSEARGSTTPRSTSISAPSFKR